MKIVKLALSLSFLVLSACVYTTPAATPLIPEVITKSSTVPSTGTVGIMADAKNSDRVEVSLTYNGKTITQTVPVKTEARFVGVPKGTYDAQITPLGSNSRGSTTMLTVVVPEGVAGTGDSTQTVKPKEPRLEGATAFLAADADNADSVEISVDGVSAKQYPAVGAEAAFTNLSSGAHVARYVAVKNGVRSVELTKSFTTTTTGGGNNGTATLTTTNRNTTYMANDPVILAKNAAGDFPVQFTYMNTSGSVSTCIGTNRVEKVITGNTVTISFAPGFQYALNQYLGTACSGTLVWSGTLNAL